MGTEAAPHVHEHSDDLLYVVHGRAKMGIEGRGDVPLAPGTFLRIPKGVWHQPHDIDEDFLAYDVWYPYLV